MGIRKGGGLYINKMNHNLSQYPIGEMVRVEKNKAGNTSNTFKITTNYEKWFCVP